MATKTICDFAETGEHAAEWHVVPLKNTANVVSAIRVYDTCTDHADHALLSAMRLHKDPKFYKIEVTRVDDGLK